MFDSNSFKGTWAFIVIMMFIGIFSILGLAGWGLWHLIKLAF